MMNFECDDKSYKAIYRHIQNSKFKIHHSKIKTSESN